MTSGDTGWLSGIPALGTGAESYQRGALGPSQPLMGLDPKVGWGCLLEGAGEVTTCLPWDEGKGDGPSPSPQEDREQPKSPAPAGGRSWERVELDPGPAYACIGGRRKTVAP